MRVDRRIHDITHELLWLGALTKHINAGAQGEFLSSKPGFGVLR